MITEISGDGDIRPINLEIEFQTRSILQLTEHSDSPYFEAAASFEAHDLFPHK